MALRFSPSRGAGSFALSAAVRGPTGAAATIAVGTTTTLAEAAAATVSNSGSSSAATFNFGIPRGSTPAIGFNFDTDTTDADPGAGDVKFNNATPASVTTIYFDNVDRDGNTVTTWLDSFDDSTTTAKGTLIITPSATPSAKLVYSVTGTVTDGTGYRKVTVAHVAGTTLPTAAAQLAVTFSRVGDRGISPGFRQTYPSTTTDADPGAGIFRLNNATPASATAAYLDNVDFGGTTVSGIMDLWDDSTNTIKGSIQFVNQDDPTIWATFNVTGSVVDGTGYRKLTLASGQANGSFSGVFAVSFARAGDKGADGVISGSTGATDNRVLRADGVGGATLQNSAVAIDDTGGVTGVLTVDIGNADTTVSRDSAGVIAVEGVALFSNIPINSQSAAYPIVLTDAQKCIYHPSSDNNARTFTIPANASVAFPVGTAITFVNEINTVTIAITTDTMTLAGTGATGSRSLAANGTATAIKVASTKWAISGVGLT